MMEKKNDGPQMTTIRFAFMIAWITLARWLTELVGGTRKLGKGGGGEDGFNGKKTVICEWTSWPLGFVGRVRHH